MDLSAEVCLKIYTDMWRIRLFEEEADRQTNLGNVVGTLHMYCGEEAVATGVCANLRDDDYVLGTHRSHGHCIAKGCDINLMMAEIFGKETGLCGGKAGSMHIADLQKGTLGANGVVGAGAPLALGAALTAKSTNSGNIAVTFLGDGAANEGIVFESLNLAVVLNLPVIFLIENNGYGEATANSYAAGNEDLAGRASAFGMPAEQVDGTDFFAIYNSVKKAVDLARSGAGPSVIETIHVTRWFGHYEGDPQLYRKRGEIKDLRTNRDPLKIFRSKTGQKVSPEEFEIVNRDVKMQIDAAVEFAMTSPPPSLDTLVSDVYLTY